MWQELIDTLKKIHDTYNALFEIAEKKHGFLVAVDLKSLEAILPEEKKLTSKVEALENTRREILKKIAAKETRIRPDMKMAELFALAPDRLTRQSLEVIHKSLNEAVTRVKKKSEVNEILAMGALSAVTTKLNRIGGAAVEPTYGQNGGDVVSHRKNFEFRA